MNIILKVILAVYKFFVGDLVILLGVTLLMVALALLHFQGALAPLRGGSGAILIVGGVATLGREVRRVENKEKVEPFPLVGHAKLSMFVHARLVHPTRAVMGE